MPLTNVQHDNEHKLTFLNGYETQKFYDAFIRTF